MEYSHLTKDEQERMLIDRIRTLEAEHFQNMMVRRTHLVATDVSEPQRAAQLRDRDKALETIELAHSQARRQLAIMRGEQPDDIDELEAAVAEAAGRAPGGV